MESTATIANANINVSESFKNKILSSKTFEDLFNHIINNPKEKPSQVIDEILSDMTYSHLETSIFNKSKILTQKRSNQISENTMTEIDQTELFITNFILSFFSKLSHKNSNHIHIINKVLSKPEVLKEIFEIISKFKNLKIKGFLDLKEEFKSTALDILLNQSLNSKFWKTFIEIFDLTENLLEPIEVSKSQATPSGNSTSPTTPLIISFINDQVEKSIKENSKKLENLLKLIEIAKDLSTSSHNFYLQINYKDLFGYLLNDKNFTSIVKKLLVIYPQELESVIDFYLKKNDTRSASNLVKEYDLDAINPKIREDIIYKSRCKAINYHYHQYYNYEIDFQQLIELTDSNKLIVSFLFELCCRDKLYAESFHILKMTDFNLRELKIEESSMKSLQEYLIKLGTGMTGKIGKKIIASNKKHSSKNNLKYIKDSSAEFLNDFQYDFSNEPRNLNQESYLDTSSNPNQSMLCCGREFFKSFVNHKQLQIINEDYFAPYEYNCMKLPLKIKDIIFVDSLQKFKKISELSLIDKNYPFIGFDSEWKSTTSIFDKENGVSIIQLATKNKVIILDMVKINSFSFEELKEFTNVFMEIFKEKTVIGFNYKMDMDNIKNPEIKNCFNEIKSLDLINVYESKFKTKCPGLKKVCKEILKKDLCKYEQISNWENRPLRLRQLHYAALDAYVLLILYEKM